METLSAGLPVEHVNATSLADEIAFRVESAILEGAYPPGSRLPQDELCERFGVSRTPVREALRKLQARNVVVVVPNKGATVRLATRKELMDVYDIRSELEGYGCALAAARMTDEVVADLDGTQSRLIGLVDEFGDEPDDRAPASLHLQVNRANDEFHTVIHRTAGNQRLQQIIADLGRQFPKDVVSRAMRSSDEMRALNVEEHGRIRSALAAGDGLAARDEMRRHILHARGALLRYLDELGFWQ